jgi:hypothetical protein
MAIYEILKGGVFEPKHIEAMGQAFEAVCSGLELTNRDDPLRDLVAAKSSSALNVASMILSASPGSSYRRSNNCRLGVQSERELVSSLLRSLRCRNHPPVGTRERFARFPFCPA